MNDYWGALLTTRFAAPIGHLCLVPTFELADLNGRCWSGFCLFERRPARRRDPLTCTNPLAREWRLF